jgi:hypothetical protein
MDVAPRIAMVYGFELPYRNVELRGSSRFYIGAKGYGQFPIYYAVCLQSTTLEEILYEMEHLTETQLTKKAMFEEFASQYCQIPTWQLACVGEFEINMAYDTKNSVLERIRCWQEEMDAGFDSNLYNEHGDGYSEETIRYLKQLLVEEDMRFIIDDVLKTKNLQEVCLLIEYYYAQEL